MSEFGADVDLIWGDVDEPEEIAKDTAYAESYQRLINTSFTYTPLDLNQASIRLIKVLPTLSHSGTIQCEISHASLEERFVCLSYVWGNLAEGQLILLNGEPHYVRPSLWSFLGFARLKYPHVPLWIDALSIAQNNVEERNHQVKQMGQIYRKADHVLVWLGEGPGLVAYFNLVENYNQSDERGSTAYWRKKSLEFFDGHERFARHVYWTRAWISQEVALANKLAFVAHDIEISRDLMVEFTKTTGLRGSKQFTKTWDFICTTERRKRYPLFQLLELFQDRQCMLPRDRVYSLISLSLEQADLQVDYEADDLAFMKHIFGICRSSACLCSASLLVRSILNPWDYFTFKPESLEDVQKYGWTWRAEKEGRDNEESLLKKIQEEKTPTLARKTYPKKFAPRRAETHTCESCRWTYGFPADVDHKHLYVLCLVEICSAAGGHLIWNDSLSALWITDERIRKDGSQPPAFKMVEVGDIQIKKTTEPGTFWLIFSLGGLLYREWCTANYGAYIACNFGRDFTPAFLDRHNLCSEAREGRSSFRVLSPEPWHPIRPSKRGRESEEHQQSSRKKRCSSV